MTLTLVASYGLVAIVAMIRTRLEQRDKGIDGFLPCMGGVVACLLWPLTLTVVMIAARLPDPEGSVPLSD